MISKIVTILGPFAIRTIFIRVLGAEYLGLNSLFSSILTVLNLTELGFSSAIVFSLYKPIAEDDSETIEAILLYYRKVYACIGAIILAIGLLLIPFLPNLISGSYPEDINLVLVYVVYLLNTVISYFLFAYLQALISAFQREDLISRVNIVISIVMYIAQAIVLLTVKNYYAYLFIMPAFTVINNLRTAFIAKRYFPQYKPKGKLAPEIKKDIKVKVSGLMITKVCNVSRNAFDSIFISMFLGLTDTAIYNNYYYIMNAITALLTIVVTSITAGVGNSVSIDPVEKNYSDMNKMNFIYMWISGWCTVCLFCLYQPFMKMWAGEDLMFPMLAVILICAYFYALKIGDIRSVYVQATGIWWENRYRAIAEATANIVLNYFLGKYFGVYGIISATLISLLVINFGYGSQLIYKYYFKEQKISEYYLSNLFYAIVTLIACVITYFICNLIGDGIGFFILKMLICVAVPNILFWLIYRHTSIYKIAVPWFLGKLPQRFTSKLHIKNF